MVGLIIDTNIFVAAERRREAVNQIVKQIAVKYGPTRFALASISAVELTHSLYRTLHESQRQRRQAFLDGVFSTLAVIPLTLEIAQLAGKIEGEQAANGIGIPFEDLLIGATALHLSFDVLTLNTKHFELIPGLTVRSL